MPEEGWCKLNCDGAVTNYGSKAGCGGVVRDANGCFLYGFAAGLGSCSITEAELWAICRGLQLAQDRGLHQIAIETDSVVAKNLIVGDCSPLHPCFNLVKNIWDMLDLQRRFSLKHIFREANQVADGFAKFSLKLDCNHTVFTSLLAFVSMAFAADCNGVIYPRGF